ncbi:hypothetical protein T492DRAFT_950816 [Pavlovales sp. CCMP2436]|nr:hypothetical protein T492DRAFT_950816 [Pavlovales sp. CCMP2436]|eukprot:CAMPEP_0179874552 /NCGR_PEP_ID=MMETSP0982-20121206/22930_1 /TAXON_ID=483367 /ORGANISM="non described non described, Strain CCMP 2436" /LENGTH=345 /DNA_ID=CAMNT_0021766317 /DNA_START=22 /DNA_END=1059 /DNA_ORIENTATION=+
MRRGLGAVLSFGLSVGAMAVGAIGAHLAPASCLPLAMRHAMLRRVPLRPTAACTTNSLDAAKLPSTRACVAMSTLTACINLDGLKSEATRVLGRALKRLDKARERAQQCAARRTELLADPAPADSDLMALPDCDELAAQLAAEATRAARLQQLVDALSEVVTLDHPRAGAAFALAAELEVGDTPPVRPPPAVKKPKGPHASKEPRLPYRTYLSAGGAEIRVGRTAADNDKLSCEPEHRDSDDWWMHAAGCPGSHVVIRMRTLPGGELSREVEMDAAMLAAKYSKSNPGGTVGVTLCQARQVRKPMGSVDGLVQLSGSVRTVRVAWSKEQHRLARLEATLEAASGA